MRKGEETGGQNQASCQNRRLRFVEWIAGPTVNGAELVGAAQQPTQKVQCSCRQQQWEWREVQIFGRNLVQILKRFIEVLATENGECEDSLDFGLCICGNGDGDTGL